MARHPTENQEYAKARLQKKVEEKEIEKMASASSSKSQSVLTKHHAMIKKDEPKRAFRQAFAKWVVDEALPLCIGKSMAFKEMIQVANWRMHAPDSKLLKTDFYGKERACNDQNKKIHQQKTLFINN